MVFVLILIVSRTLVVFMKGNIHNLIVIPKGVGGSPKDYGRLQMGGNQKITYYIFFFIRGTTQP